MRQYLPEQRQVLAVGGEHPVEAGSLDSWLRYQGSESGNKVQRLEDDVGGAVGYVGLETADAPIVIRSCLWVSATGKRCLKAW